MIIKNSIKGVTKMKYLFLMLIIILIQTPCAAISVINFDQDYNIPLGTNCTNFIQTKNKEDTQSKNKEVNFYLNTSTPKGIDIPYGHYNYIKNLSLAYIALDNRLREIIDKAIADSNPKNLKQELYTNSLSMGDLKSSIITLLKSPYYKDGKIVLSQSTLENMQDKQRLLNELAIDVISKMLLEDKQYIRDFDTLAVEPTVRGWPEFNYIKDAHFKAKSILEDIISYAGVEEYKNEIERAVIASIAGFNYDDDRLSQLSEDFTSQALEDFKTRIEYWLKSKEFIPVGEFKTVKKKAIELFDSLTFESGLYPESPWRGEIAEIYRILGGQVPTYEQPGRLVENADWGEDIYDRLWDIASQIEKIQSNFGTLMRGPQMSIQQLKHKLQVIGPAIVGFNAEGGKKYIRVFDITTDAAGKEIIVYENDSGNSCITMSLEEFNSSWDKFVYVEEGKSEFAKPISDFDFNPESYSLIDEYGQFTINEFDETDSDIGINANIALTEKLPYFYTRAQVGGSRTYKYAGYFQNGIWINFNNDIKQHLPRGTALSFDTYLPDYPKFKYLRIELKEAESGKKVAEYVLSKEDVNLGEWNTLKIPIHYYPKGTLQLTVGMIGSYPDHYQPRDCYMAIDRVYVE